MVKIGTPMTSVGKKAILSLLLVQQLVMESYDAAVERIMTVGVAVMVGVAVLYSIYRYIDSKSDANSKL